MDETRAFEDRKLAPVARRARWIAWGLALQLAGVGVPVVVVLRRAAREDALGQITRSTVRLAWHEALRSPGDFALGLAGLALFVLGSVLLARPFATSRRTLYVGVPVAAVCGVLVLGAAALLCAGLAALAVAAGDGDLGPADLNWMSGWWPQRSRRRDREDPPE